MTMPVEQSRLEALMAQNATVLAQLNARLQATLPLYIEETAISPVVDETTKAVLDIAPTRDTYFKVTGILVVVPFGTTAASLQLGSQFTIPLQNTTTLLTPVQKLLVANDVRQLVFTTGSDNGGQAFVWLWGEAIPKYGKL
jgi:hypothetical protein